MCCCGWTKQERFCHRAPLKRRMTNGERLSILIQISLFERLVCCLSGRRGVGECKRKSSYSHGSWGNAKQKRIVGNSTTMIQNTGHSSRKFRAFVWKSLFFLWRRKRVLILRFSTAFSSFSSRARASAVFRFLPSPLHLCCVSAWLSCCKVWRLHPLCLHRVKAVLEAFVHP